jgi:hypothetical protein
MPRENTVMSASLPASRDNRHRANSSRRECPNVPAPEAPVTRTAERFLNGDAIKAGTSTGQSSHLSSVSELTPRIAVTILIGPFNYAGVNPKISCHMPKPSN